jgi:predicted amidohydrolase
MRALLAQLCSQAGAIEANLARLQGLLGEHRDVQLAVLPELFLQGYRLGSAARQACTADGQEIGRVRAAAKRAGTAVVVGFAERAPSGELYNSAACIDADGSLVGVHRKTHLFGPREREVFRSGECLHLVELAGLAVAPLICFEVEFPEPARALACAGADILVTIASNMSPYGAEHELAIRARALENRRPHLYVNSVGRCEDLVFVGGSAVIGCDGVIAASAGAEEEVLEVEVPRSFAGAGTDIDYLNRVRFDLPVTIASNHTEQGGADERNCG